MDFRSKKHPKIALAMFEKIDSRHLVTSLVLDSDLQVVPIYRTAFLSLSLSLSLGLIEMQSSNAGHRMTVLASEKQRCKLLLRCLCG